MDKFRFSIKSFIVKDNKILAIKRRPDDIHMPNIWEIPGGRLDLGEDPQKGLERETKEETGLDIKVSQILNVRHFTREDGQEITMLVFLCEALTDDVKLSKEHTEFSWVPLENAKEKFHKLFHSDIDAYSNLFKQRT